MAQGGVHSSSAHQDARVARRHTAGAVLVHGRAGTGVAVPGLRGRVPNEEPRTCRASAHRVCACRAVEPQRPQPVHLVSDGRPRRAVLALEQLRVRGSTHNTPVAVHARLFFVYVAQGWKGERAGEEREEREEEGEEGVKGQ